MAETSRRRGLKFRLRLGRSRKKICNFKFNSSMKLRFLNINLMKLGPRGEFKLVEFGEWERMDMGFRRRVL